LTIIRRTEKLVLDIVPEESISNSHSYAGATLRERNSQLLLPD